MHEATKFKHFFTTKIMFTRSLRSLLYNLETNRANIRVFEASFIYPESIVSMKSTFKIRQPIFRERSRCFGLVY
jgi:hypothetical protein